jgi:hypothetical protein
MNHCTTRGGDDGSPPATDHTPLELGQVVATPGALQAMATSGQDQLDLLQRHRHGDWGELDEHDRQANQQACRDGGRVLSAYVLADHTRIWIVTEADRSSTCILLPEEY